MNTNGECGMDWVTSIAAGVAVWLTVRVVCQRFNLWPYRARA